jgi:hypothetical protein
MGKSYIYVKQCTETRKISHLNHVQTEILGSFLDTTNHSQQFNCYTKRFNILWVYKYFQKEST